MIFNFCRSLFLRGVALILLAPMMLFNFTSCKAPSQEPVQVWPEITNEMKPWVRWWWMGSAVNEGDLGYLLDEFAAKGFGGVEIQPIYGVQGQEPNYIEFLSPRWMELLSFVVNHANQLGLGVDMTTGTGWPFGGPHVHNDVAARRLFLQEYQVEAGQADLPLIVMNNRHQLAYNPRLIAIMAYGPNGEVENITGALDASNRLTWSPVAGTWQVIAAFDGHNRMLVKRAAPGGEGYTFDHLNADALAHYLTWFDNVFQGQSPGIRAFFNDSYEVFGASWSKGFLEEFNLRRGYDLRDYLRELNNQGDVETIARVKADYRETMSELLIYNFSKPWTEWTNRLGAKSRNQSHGSPANLIDVYATVDIPEIETFGGEFFPIDGFFWDEGHINLADHNPLFLKMAASAANIAGKRLVSCETFTWVGEHFRSPLSQNKPEAEQLFLSGVNHIFYHGSTYSPRAAAWPGWLFYASVHFGPTNSFWPHVSALNEYITRCQSILQQGATDNDILVYWPIFDTWQNPEGLKMMMTVHGSREWLNKPNIQSLLDRGFSFDFVSDSLLWALQPNDNRLYTVDRQNYYNAIVVPTTRYMPIETLERLLSLAEQGIPVIFESLPADVPGLANLQSRRDRKEYLLDGFSEDSPVEGVTTMRKGRKELIVSANIEAALSFAGVERETLTDTGLKFTRRHSDQGLYYYLVNHTDLAIDTFLTLNNSARSVIMLDPQTGNYGIVPATRDGNKTRVRLQARSGEAFFLLLTDKNVSQVPAWNYREATGDVTVVDGQWVVEFVEGGPTLPGTVNINGLKPWTGIGDANIDNFSGTARYSITFNMSQVTHDQYQLNLGRVFHSARVKLNGNDLGLVWSPPFIVDVRDYLRAGENHLQIEVANLMANRIRYMDINKHPWKIFHDINMVNIWYRPFDASGWEVMTSGLEGPVTITPQMHLLQ